MKNIVITVHDQFDDEDIGRSYLQMDIEKHKDGTNELEKIIASFHYPSEYIEEGNEFNGHKSAIRDVSANLDKYLALIKIEDMSPETILLLEHHLFSSESTYYHSLDSENERDSFYEQLIKDIPTEHHDKFERYEDDELALYGDFISIFNISNMELAREKTNEHFENIEKDEGLE